MKVIVIHGAPAVGKLTVAKALAKKTGYVILHNHLTIDLALLFFPYGSPSFHRLLRRLRFAVLEEALNRDIEGIIWTTGLPNVPEIRLTYRRLDKFMERHGGSTHYVHLVCDRAEQKKRLKGVSRKKFKKLQSVAEFKKVMKKLDFTPGHVGKSAVRIDNTHLSPQEVAEKIVKQFSLRKGGAR